MWATSSVPRSSVRVRSNSRRKIDRPVEFEVLHGGHTGRAITDFAQETNASLIFTTTHGRTGLARCAPVRWRPK